MLRRFSRSGGSSSVPEPKVSVYLRMLTPYPGDKFPGIVQLYLPTKSDVLLVEAVIVGWERARIGVLSGGANIEARRTVYYQQYITVIGAVPPAVMEARRKASTKKARAGDSDRGWKKEDLRRGSMHKQASVLKAEMRRGNSNLTDRRGADGDDESSLDQNTALYAPTTIDENQVVQLEAGTYTFPFAVELPNVLPPSGSMEKGKEAICKVEYCVKVRVLMRHGKAMRCEAPFALRMLPVQLQRWLMLHRPENAASSFPVPALPPSCPKGTDDMPSTVATMDSEDVDKHAGYDLGLEDPNVDDAAETASVATGGARPSSHSGKRPSSSSGAVTGSGDYERTQRRCIDHRVHLSSARLRREEAAFIAAAAKEAKRAACEHNREAEDNADSVVAMGDKGATHGEAVAATRTEGERAKGRTQKTRMLASEVEKIGFAFTGVASDDEDTAEQEAVNEQRRRMHHRRHHHRRHEGPEGNSREEKEAWKAAAAADGAQSSSSGGGSDARDDDALLGERKGVCVDRGGRPASANPKDKRGGRDAVSCSRTLREPIWEHNFLMPLRSGLMSKGEIRLQVTLHANVLHPGRDTARVSAIVDNTQGGAAITRVRYSLIVRQMIRSKSETYPFSRVEADVTRPANIPKGKVARLPLEEIKVPGTVPLTVFTDGGYSTTFLNIRFYSSTALKTYSRSVEIELLMVSGTDVQNKSKRLLHWTNFFVGRGLAAGAESGQTLDLNSTNLNPTVLNAAASGRLQDSAARDVPESLMGDRSVTNAADGKWAATTALPQDNSGSSPENSSPSLLSPFSTACVLAKHTRMCNADKKAMHSAKAAAPTPLQLPASVRRTLNYDEPTYLPLMEAGTMAHADPLGGVNPLMAPRPGQELDFYEVSSV